MNASKINQTLCPVCGAKDFDSREEERRIGDRFSGMETLKEDVFVCRKCSAEGDFAGENDRRYEEAMARLAKKAVGNILATLGEQGISMAEFERAMGLPQRTAARWKKDGASAAAVALLKAVATFPWIMEVAESRYESDRAAGILMREAGKSFLAHMPSHDPVEALPMASERKISGR